MSPGHTSMSFIASKVEQRSNAGGLKEAFMRERVAQLEAELKGAHVRQGLVEDDAKRVGVHCREEAVVVNLNTDNDNSN